MVEEELDLDSARPSKLRERGRKNTFLFVLYDFITCMENQKNYGEVRFLEPSPKESTRKQFKVNLILVLVYSL